jgi:PST family polysaccharide transporter
MTEEASSYRQILRATSIIGGATIGSILIGLVRTKIFSLVIGPAGIGLMGVLNSIMMTGAVLAGAGLGTSGVREVAAADAKDDSAAAVRVRVALWSLTWMLALAGALTLWVLREPLARFAAVGTEHAGLVGWLSIGLLLSVVAASQSAVLQGYRRIADIGRIKLYGAIIAAVLGIVAIAVDAYAGIALALIAIPLGSVLVALWCGRRLPALGSSKVTARQVKAEWTPLLTLGLGVMAWTLISQVTQLGVRAIIVDETSLDEAGLFQAAWMTSTNYIGLVLGAMSADYLPRLSALDRSPETQKLVDHQLHVALLLSLPLIAVLIAAAPLALTVLYSSAFTEAASLLRWQLAGDFLKIAGWAVGFVLLARKDMVVFLLAEAALSLVYICGVGLLLPRIGLQGAGVAYFGAYLLYLGWISILSLRRHRIVISRGNWSIIAVALPALLVLIGASYISEAIVLVTGAAIAAAFTFTALRQLGSSAGISSRILASRGYGSGNDLPSE